MAAGDTGHYIQCYSTNTGAFNYAYQTASDTHEGNVEIHKDSDTFTHSTSTLNHRVTVEAAGHYLLSHNLYLEDTDLTSYFMPLLLLELNGSWLMDYGWCANFTRGNTYTADTGISSATILNLAADDYIDFRISEIDSSSGNAALVSGRHGWSMVKLNDSWSYFRAQNDDGDDDVAVNDIDSTWTNITWKTEDEKDTGYTHSTVTDSHEITLDDAGYYLVLASIQIFNSSGNARKRTNIITDMALDGNHVDGTFGNIYVRNYPNGAFDHGWINMEKLVKTTTASQKLSFRAMHVNNTSASNAVVKSRAVTIVKLPDAADYCRIYEDSNMETNTAANFDFTAQTEVDSSFSHSTSTNPDRITANSAFLGLFIFHSEVDWATDPATGEDEIIAGLVWDKNGTALNYGYTSICERGNTGATEHGHRSGRSALCLIDLASSDYVTIENQVWGNSEANAEHQALEITMDAINLNTAFSPPAASRRVIML